MTADAATEARFRKAEEARRSAMTTAALTVEKAMTEEERARFLSLTAAAGTGLDGAAVADVLDIYSDHDECLQWTEPFYDDGRLRPLYAAIGHDPEGELPDDRDGMLDQYRRGITLSLAVLARAVLMQAVPDVESVQALAVKALAEPVR